MGPIVIIGGCGHVGLPLGLAIAKAGIKVFALDLAKDKVDLANSGKMPFEDRGCDELLKDVLAKGTFHCTTDQKILAEADIVITVIGTPLDEHLNPKFDVYRNLIEEGKSYLRDGQLLVLRSTVYPGTTERLAHAFAREGRNIDVAFCPERVAEGVALEEIYSLPQIVAGCSPRAQERAEALFKKLTKHVLPLKPLAAELTKLYTNTWRYVQFAVANQFFMIANDYGIDFNEIHNAMTFEYPRAKGFPRAGFAAGPCLFKDTMQLSCFNNNALFVGHAAMLVNEGLPGYIVKRANARFELRNKTVGILGMTFKADSDDPRDSLAFKLRKILQMESRAVLCSDPYYTMPGFVSSDEILSRCDVIFIGAPHTPYKTMDFKGKPVIDIWNCNPQGMHAV